MSDKAMSTAAAKEGRGEGPSFEGQGDGHGGLAGLLVARAAELRRGRSKSLAGVLVEALREQGQSAAELSAADEAGAEGAAGDEEAT